VDKYSDLVVQMADYTDMVSKQRHHMAEATRHLIDRVFGQGETTRIPYSFLEKPSPWSEAVKSTGTNLTLEELGTERGSREDVNSVHKGDANAKGDGEHTGKEIGRSGCRGPSVDSNGCYLSVWTGYDLSEGGCQSANVEEGRQCGPERGHKGSVHVAGELIGPWAAHSQGGHTSRLPPVLVHPGFRPGSWFEWVEVYASRWRVHGDSVQVKLPVYSTIRDEWRGGILPLSESKDSGDLAHPDSVGTRLQILYPRDGAVYLEGYVPVSYMVEGPVPESFRIGVFLDGDALDVFGRGEIPGRGGGVLETPFTTLFRTFDVWLDAGPHHLVLELVDGDGAHLYSASDENLNSALAVAAISIEAVCFFCTMCCDPPVSSHAVAAHQHVSSLCAPTLLGSRIEGVETQTILIVIVVFNQVEMLSYQVS